MNVSPAKGVVDRVAWLLLCAFVFSIPLEKTVAVPGVGTIAHLVGVVAFAAALVVVLRRRSIRPPNLAMALAALFVVWAGATWFWSLDRPLTLSLFFTFAQLFGMLWLIWESCRGPERQDWLMAAYVGGMAVAAVDTIVRYAKGQETYYLRYAAAGFEPNDFGVTVALSIPLALYLAGRARGAAAWAYRAAVVLAIAAVYLTASRTALIATVAAFSVIVFLWRSWGREQKVSGVVLFALLVAGFVQFAPRPARERLATIPSALVQGQFHNRTTIWKAGLRVFKHHLVLGVGADAYPEAVRPQLGVPGLPGHRYVAHNTFLSVLVEQGLVGFSVFGLLLGVLAVYIWMMPWRERALWAVMLAVWVVGVSTLTWEPRKPTWLLFALIMTAWARAFQPNREQRS